MTIDTFAAGLSGKLENGDIISLIVVDKTTGTATIPEALTYMKVITTTTAGGIDQDSIVKNEDGSYEIPSTVTLLCNREQAMLLAKYESETTLTVALVYRGSSENAKLFLDRQDEYFLTEHEEPADPTDEPPETDEPVEPALTVEPAEPTDEPVDEGTVSGDESPSTRPKRILRSSSSHSRFLRPLPFPPLRFRGTAAPRAAAVTECPPVLTDMR